MPTEWLGSMLTYPKTWKSMGRYERKQFHRENSLRIQRGKQPKQKP